jgi:hypothetical protein
MFVIQAILWFVVATAVGAANGLVAARFGVWWIVLTGPLTLVSGFVAHLLTLCAIDHYLWRRRNPPSDRKTAEAQLAIYQSTAAPKGRLP